MSGGASGAALGCASNPITAADGVASFSCSVNKPGTGYKLEATSGSLTKAKSYGVHDHGRPDSDHSERDAYLRYLLHQPHHRGWSHRHHGGLQHLLHGNGQQRGNDRHRIHSGGEFPPSPTVGQVEEPRTSTPPVERRQPGSRHSHRWLPLHGQWMCGRERFYAFAAEVDSIASFLLAIGGHE